MLFEPSSQSARYRADMEIRLVERPGVMPTPCARLLDRRAGGGLAGLVRTTCHRLEPDTDLEGLDERPDA